MKTAPLLLVVLIAIVGQASGASVTVQQDQQASNVADDLLYPFGEGQGDKTTPIIDDGCSQQEHLQQEFRFFGNSYKDLYVCNNGVISFNTPVSQYTPDAFPLTAGQVFIAPFWGDVDNNLGGVVYYRETQDPRVLQRITEDVAKPLPYLHFAAKWAFIATWYDVVFYGAAVIKRNTFQAAMVTDGFKYLVIMNYKKIEWTTGTASGGDRYTGLGGTPAQAGFNSGDYTHYFNIPGSRTSEVMKITSTSNVDYPGRWIFQVDEFKVPGGCIFEAKFAKDGVSFWKDSTCRTKCLCQDSKVTCVPEGCPPFRTCGLSGSFFTCTYPKHNCTES